MIVESLWKNVKHRDLKDFNRPRLDLVTYIVLTSVLSRVKLTLASVLALRRSGRAVALAGWQEDLKKDWLDFSRTDEHRMTEKELHYLKAPKNTKGRSERLAQIAEEETRPRGKYLTDLQRWVCSCPAYLISRFLLCKHLVRQANIILKDLPLRSLEFFLKLRRQHYPPYYIIEGIHVEVAAREDSGTAVNIRVLGHMVEETRATNVTSNVPSRDLTEANATMVTVNTRRDESMTHEVGAENAVGDEEDEGLEDGVVERVFLTEANLQHWSECFEHMMSVSKRRGGLHPKMAAVLTEAFGHVERVGGDIGRHMNRRVAQRTWKDSNRNTMFLD